MIDRRQLLRDILALVDANSRSKVREILFRQKRWMDKYPDDTEIEGWGEMLTMLLGTFS